MLKKMPQNNYLNRSHRSKYSIKDNGGIWYSCTFIFITKTDISNFCLFSMQEYFLLLYFLCFTEIIQKVKEILVLGGHFY